MASISGNSSGSTRIQNSGSEDQRKRKRMESNRESARKSRLRKQKHVDDLMSQVNEFKKDNSKILTTMRVTREQLVKAEAENSVLRAQMSELTQRLDSLNEIMNYINSSGISNQCTNGTSGKFEFEYENEQYEFMNNPWELVYVNQQPIVASADMFQY